MNEVYITSMGSFLPGPPVGNDEIEEYLGRIGGKSSRTMRRILEQNRIRYRHYAIDKTQRSLYTNAEMGALAIQHALRLGEEDLSRRIDFLAAGTTQGDLLVPGFASMVHAETGLPTLEIATHHGVCGSGMQAMKNAFLQVQSGKRRPLSPVRASFRAGPSSTHASRSRRNSWISRFRSILIFFASCSPMVPEPLYFSPYPMRRGFRRGSNGSTTNRMPIFTIYACLRAQTRRIRSALMAGLPFPSCRGQRRGYQS